MELKLNTTIKRLRAEKSELENQTKQISGKLEQATGEISTLKSKLNDNAENDKKQNGKVAIAYNSGGSSKATTFRI